MKKVLYVLLIVFQISLAQTPFEQGNQYYAKENYQAAIDRYESIVNSGKQSAELYFNLGNSYYKLHRVGPAIYNYEKALLLSPNDAEIKTNLEFARKMAIDDIKVIPKVGFNKLLSDFTSKYHYDAWAWIAVVFAFLFLAFFIGYYFSNKTFLKRFFFIGMFLWLMGIVLSAASGFYEKSRNENERPAIVFAEVADVRSEPQNASATTFVLHAGTKVYVEETLGYWKKIQLTDGTEGWIDARSIKEVKD